MHTLGQVVQKTRTPPLTQTQLKTAVIGPKEIHTYDPYQGCMERGKEEKKANVYMNE